VFAKNLLFYETILILVGEELPLPFYNNVSKIINPNPVGADSFIRPLYEEK